MEKWSTAVQDQLLQIETAIIGQTSRFMKL